MLEGEKIQAMKSNIYDSSWSIGWERVDFMHLTKVRIAKMKNALGVKMNTDHIAKVIKYRHQINNQ